MDLTLSNFNVLSDIWGSTDGIKMSFSGNQWFVIQDLLNFLNSKGLVAYIETIPPGLVRKRAEGENLKIGNLEITFKPEIVSLPTSLLMGLDIEKSKEYVKNDLAIVYNDKKIEDWCDLKEKKIAIPNPQTEGIGQLFRELYEENCGKYEELISSSNIYLTKVHHREIPAMLMNKQIEAGIVWRTEAIYWKFNHTVPKKNKKGRLAFALLKNTSEQAKSVYNLLFSHEVKSIYEKYGFRWIGD